MKPIDKLMERSAKYADRVHFTVGAQPKTNADYVRSMTDEELAEFIGSDPMHDFCPNDCFEDPDRQCKMCALKWLKKECG